MTTGEDARARDAYAPAKIRLLMELRRSGIGDLQTLAALERTPREMFVPAEFRHRAYENIALPIDCGQTISQPYIVAYMTEQLRIHARCKVLEIGTGSGYQCAVLSRLARRVYTIERHGELLRQAEERFRRLGLANITSRTGNGADGWPEQGSFDRILVTAAARSADAWTAQLSEGGILIAPVLADGGHRLERIIRSGGAFQRESLLPVRFVPLVEAEATPGCAGPAGRPDPE